MKTIKKFIFLIMFVLALPFAVFACDLSENSNNNNNNNITTKKLDYDMSQVSWNYVTAYTYDATEKVIELTNLPDGVTVKNYFNNRKIDAGTYYATALFNYDTTNYNAPAVKGCNWKINKADITGITFEDKSVNYNNQEQEVTISGILPEGVSVLYTNNKQTEPGAYTAKAVLSGANYNTLTLTAKFTIKPNITQIAKSVLGSMLKIPDVWDFLPDSFALEKKVCTGNTSIDFSTNFVNVSSLPKNGFGKQMNVVYSTLLDVETALSYVRYIYSCSNAIIGYYQDYVNANVNNYASYEKTTENFTFKIMLSDSDYKMCVSYKSVAIELAYKLENQKCEGRVQLSNSNVVKYEISDNELTVASSIFGLSLTKIHFERNDNSVNGYLIEYYGTETKNIKTSAIISIDENCTSIISNKRETDDLLIDGYMEVYSNETGNLIGCEVKENVKCVDYDTKWFNLYDITGINTIKVLDESNGLNADSIYINGSDNLLAAKKVGGFSLATASRRFDIEMKDMYFYQYNEEEEKYEKIKINIPMLFIQNDYISSFNSDFYSTNKGNGASSNTNINLSNNVKNYFNREFENLVDDFKTLKETITYVEIKTYLGNKNSYFND